MRIARAFVVIGIISVLLMQTVTATITIQKSGKKFASKLDPQGKQLWRGYEYYARLQHVDRASVCNTTTTRNNNKTTVIRPADGVPVAIVLTGPPHSVSCENLAQLVQGIRTRVDPPNVVRYVITADYGYSKNSLMDWEEDDDDVIISIETLDDLDDLESYKRHKKKQDSSDDDPLYPLYILHVRQKTSYELLNILLHQDSSSRNSGGPRIAMDSRLGTGGVFSGESAAWMAVSALVSACACSFLLVINGWCVEEPEPPEPQRPRRRRLTRDQIRQLFPIYRYDGEHLHLLDQPAAGEADSGGDGLETEEPVAREVAPTVSDIECSICLDEYEAGDKLRVLNCNHAFHARCVGRWLHERSAVCPLCKEDLYVSQDEESVELEQVVQLAEPPVAEVTTTEGSYWSRLYQRMTATDADEDAPNEARPSRRSWWSRLFSAEENNAGSLTEPLLADEESPGAVETNSVVQEAPEPGPAEPVVPPGTQEAATAAEEESQSPCSSQEQIRVEEQNSSAAVEV